MTSTNLKPLPCCSNYWTSEKDQRGDHKTLRPIMWTPKNSSLVLSWNKIKWWWLIVKSYMMYFWVKSYIYKWQNSIMNSRSEKSVFLGHPNTFYCCVFFLKKTTIEMTGSTDLTWEVSWWREMESEWELCSAILHSNTSTTCLKLSHTSPSFSPHYPWTVKNYLNGGCTKIWISWRSI